MMKKFCSLFLAVSMLSAIPVSFSASAADRKVAVTESKRYPSLIATKMISPQTFYNNVLNSDEFKNEINRAERGEMLQLPDEMLSSLTTDELIEAVIDYPFFMDVYAFDDIQQGFDILYETFNGARELAKRTDLAPAILDKYKNEAVPMTDAETTDCFRIDDLEILLSQPFVLEKMNDEQIRTILTETSNKKSLKRKSEVYAGFSEKLFDNLIYSSDEKKSFFPPRLTLYSDPYYDGYNWNNGEIKTPNGSTVRGGIYYKEPLTQSQIDSRNKTMSKDYPSAEFVRTATAKYNCHSYAFYSQEADNNFWMSWPNVYWNDGSYYEVSIDNIGIGTRIEYLTNKTNIENVCHSAIITSIGNPSDIKRKHYTPAGELIPEWIEVISKWGPNGVYTHKVGDCPYDAIQKEKDYVNSTQYYSFYKETLKISKPFQKEEKVELKEAYIPDIPYFKEPMLLEEIPTREPIPDPCPTYRTDKIQTECIQKEFTAIK